MKRLVDRPDRFGVPALGIAFAIAFAIARPPFAARADAPPVLAFTLGVTLDLDGRAPMLESGLDFTAPHDSVFEIDPAKVDVSYRRVDHATAWHRIRPATTKILQSQSVSNPRKFDPINSEAFLELAKVPAVPGATYEFSVNLGTATRFITKTLPKRPARIAARYVGVPAYAAGAGDPDAARLSAAFKSGHAVVRRPFGVRCAEDAVTLAAGTHVTFPADPDPDPDAMFGRSHFGYVVGTGPRGDHPLHVVDAFGREGDGLFASADPFSVNFTTSLPACGYASTFFASADDMLRYLRPEAAPAATPSPSPASAAPSAPATPSTTSPAP